MLTGLEFRNSQNIIYSVLAVAAITFFILSFQKKDRILKALNLNYLVRHKALRSVLLTFGLGLVVISLMGPQVFEGYTEAQKSGLEIYVLMDTSKSMLATDIKPDRITIAKKIVENLLNSLDGDRIGFIPFASDAYIQMPLTDDYQLAKMFLDVIDTDMISGGGTNLAAALRLANDSFERVSGSDRVIIVISDGEEHDGASQNVMQNITDTNVKIYTVGVGTEKGALIPVYDNTGSTVVDYMKDDQNNPVTSRLNADVLQKLAQDGNGVYFQVSSQGTDVSYIRDELSKLKRDMMAVEKIRRFTQLYQYFLGAGILLFLLAWLLPERRAVS